MQRRPDAASAARPGADADAVAGPKASPDPKPSPDPGLPATTTTTPTKVTTTPPTATSGPQKPSQSEPGARPTEGDAAGEAQSGTQSAAESIGRAATLPFTGQRLWLVTLFGVILILTGLALREIRTADAPVESDHDHTDRSRHAADGSGTSVGGRSGR